MNNNSKLLAAVVVAALAFAVLPTGQAQSTSTDFGTQVMLGDVDFRPTAAGAQTQPSLWGDTQTVTVGTKSNIIAVDFGITGQITDDCIYFTSRAPIAAGTANAINVANFDVRLTPCQGKAAGTFVGDADTVEKSTGGFLLATAQAGGATTGPAVVYADVNNNGRYDTGDNVYLTGNGYNAGATVALGDDTYALTGSTTSASAVAASTSGGQGVWTIRLTPAGSFAAGTFVFAGDADFTAYSTGVRAFPADIDAAGATTSGFAFYDADSTGGMTTGDSIYYVPSTVAAGTLFPQHSVRVNSPQGDFGTQIGLGDLDFIPLVSAAGTTAVAAANFRTIDFGITGQVTDNCFYIDVDGDGTVENFDVRLNACQGKAAGTLVTDADTVEKASGYAAAAAAVSLRAADVNSNGRYDAEDCLFATTAAATDGDADGLADVAMASSTGNAAWTLRLTACSGKDAGTLVFAGDSDFTAYGGVEATRVIAGGFASFDADSTGSITTGDSVYIVPATPAANALFPLHSVRLVGGSGAFGTQTTLGDADFLPTLIAGDVAAAPAASQNQVDFGITAQVTDNCFYFQPTVSTPVANFDIRITPCQGNAAGTLVGDAATVEKSTAAVGNNAAQVNYADVNNNGRYDMGDCVFLTTGGATALAASTGNAAWTVRLTPCSGKEAGTLVFAGDADFSAYGGAASSTGAFAGAELLRFFDADSTGTFTAGDVMYLTPGALGASAIAPLYSLRMAGSPTASGSGVGGVGTTTTTTTPPPTTTTAPTTTMPTTTTADTGTGTGTGGPSDDTPGFGIVALLAALGAALVLVRRKL